MRQIRHGMSAAGSLALHVRCGAPGLVPVCVCVTVSLRGLTNPLRLSCAAPAPLNSLEEAAEVGGAGAPLCATAGSPTSCLLERGELNAPPHLRFPLVFIGAPPRALSSGSSSCAPSLCILWRTGPDRLPVPLSCSVDEGSGATAASPCVLLEEGFDRLTPQPAQQALQLWACARLGVSGSLGEGVDPSPKIWKPTHCGFGGHGPGGVTRGNTPKLQRCA